MNKLFITVSLLAFLAVLIMSGCETTFEPMQQNDEYSFTMYGYLDVNADTQWVRTMPIGETLIPTNATHDGTEVTITREKTNELIPLNDSLFIFSDNARVWNYWASQKIYPDEEYTITAVDVDGNQSTSRITTTSAFDYPEVEYTEKAEEGIVTGSSIDPIVTAEMIYTLQMITPMGCTPEFELTLSSMDEILRFPNGNYQFGIDNDIRIARELKILEFAYVPPTFNLSDHVRVNKRVLFIATGNEDWLDIFDLSPQERRIPDVMTNVEEGTGLIVGIASRTVEISPKRAPCPG